MNRARTEIQNTVEILLVKGIAKLFQMISHRTAQKLGGALGVIFHDLLGIRRKHGVRELLKAFPDRSEAWAREIVREVYRHLGTLVAEFARIPVMTAEDLKKWLVIDGEEHIRKAAERGQGGIICAAHMGNWEFVGPWGSRRGYKPSYVVGPQTNTRIDRFIDDLRRRQGIETIPTEVAAKGILRSLKNNRIIAFMVDQDARRAGIFIPFFGRLASTPRGPALLGLRLGSPLLTMTSFRDEAGRIHLTIRPVEYTPTGDMERDVRGIMTSVTGVMEAAIREHPEQWLWLHRRWKTRPPEESAEDDLKV